MDTSTGHVAVDTPNPSDRVIEGSSSGHVTEEKNSTSQTAAEETTQAHDNEWHEIHGLGGSTARFKEIEINNDEEEKLTWRPAAPPVHPISPI